MSNLFEDLEAIHVQVLNFFIPLCCMRKFLSEMFHTHNCFSREV